MVFFFNFICRQLSLHYINTAPLVGIANEQARAHDQLTSELAIKLCVEIIVLVICCARTTPSAATEKQNKKKMVQNLDATVVTAVIRICEMCAVSD